eukprot:TRINITY_DN1267_c2_g1_i1.p1 TRINITY_DN1267_c2_g1~~TRINITY_DN1267_c2_g1_i1.p1  ORF type:complete len:391 (+),score=98.62 TRINITY_DN1267_c2_g1_i1:68-1174(+)
MIKTTMIGSYPKPGYLKIPDWRNTDVSVFVKEFTKYTREKTKMEEVEEMRGVRDVMKQQVEAGVDYPTDGEVRRGDYISYHCCHLNGVDCEDLEEMSCRGGAYSYHAPVVRSKIQPREHFLAAEAVLAKMLVGEEAASGLKVTLPGPTTIRDTILNKFYQNDEEYLKDLAAAINSEVLHLAGSGVEHIQIDEPVFARNPSFAVQTGLKYLNACFDSVKENFPHVTTHVHICCGYPSSLDNEKEYKRADPQAYFDLLEVMDGPSNLYDYICLEDAHRPNETGLFSLFRNKGLVLGTIAIASTKIEVPEEIAARVAAVYEALPTKKLMVSPDCGMMMLPSEIAERKMKNMCAAVAIVNEKYGFACKKEIK